MKKCKNCHKYLEDYLEVCPNCGRPADRFVGEATPVSIMAQEEKNIRKKPNSKKGKNPIKKGIGILIALILCILIPIAILLAFFIFVDDFVEEDRTEEVVETNASDIESFMNLYNTLYNGFIEESPIDLVKDSEGLKRTLSQNDWKEDSDEKYSCFSKGNLYLYVYSTTDTDNLEYLNYSLYFNDTGMPIDFDNLKTIVSDYVIQNIQTPYDQGAFGLTDNIKSMIKNNATQVYNDDNSYYYYGDKIYVGMDSKEDEDLYYIGSVYGFSFCLEFDKNQNQCTSFSILCPINQ